MEGKKNREIEIRWKVFNLALARKRNDKRKYTIDLSVSTTTSGKLACAHFPTVG